MKSKFKLFDRLFVGLTMMSLIISCQENEPNIQKNQPEVWVENQTMHFNNQEAFNTTIENLHKMSQKERDDWLAEMNFNNSLYSVVNKADESEKENYVDVPDDVFASILNADGIYMIDNIIHKITQKFELVKDLGEKRSFQNIDWNKDENIKRHKILYGKGDYYYNKLYPSNNSRKVRIKDRPYGDNSEFVDANGDPVNETENLSCYLEAWNRSYLFYASAGLTIRGRKNDGGWRDDKMWYARIDYEARGRSTVPSQPWTIRSGSAAESNHKDVQAVIFYVSGPGTALDIDYFDADFTYEDDGYPRVYRYNVHYDF